MDSNMVNMIEISKLYQYEKRIQRTIKRTWN
jgi:hypothetical protein